MLDNIIKHVHQNKIREFIIHSNAVNVIFEGEEEFGSIEDARIRCIYRFRQELEKIKTPHLSEMQDEESLR